MIVVDASVWVSAWISHEAQHAISRAWLNRVIVDEVLIVPSLALAEIAGAISRVSGSAAAARRAVDSIEQFPNLQIVVPDLQVWMTAVRLAADRKLRGADAVYVAMALLLECPFATWDREIVRRAARDVRAVVPS